MFATSISVYYPGENGNRLQRIGGGRNGAPDGSFRFRKTISGVVRCCSNSRPLRAIDNKPDGYRLLMSASTCRWPGCVMSRISSQEDGGGFPASGPEHVLLMNVWVDVWPKHLPLVPPPCLCSTSSTSPLFFGLQQRTARPHSLCSNYRMQLDSPKQQHLDDGKYLQVRYEDFATLPTLVAELVYCWAGLGPLPPTVATWINDHTKMPNCDAAHGPRTRRRLATSLVGTAASHEGCGGSMAVLVSGCEQEDQDHWEIGHTGALRKPGNLRKRSSPGGASFSAPVGESAGPIAASHRQSNSSREAARDTEPFDLQGYATSVPASGATAVSTGTTNGSPPVRPNSRKALEAAAGTAGADEGDGGDCVNQKRYSDQHPYDTKRHSSAMVDLWRQQMPRADAQAVWDACQASRVMEELGYSL